jgi:hypothetical protein
VLRLAVQGQVFCRWQSRSNSPRLGRVRSWGKCWQGTVSFLIGSESRQQKTEMFTGCFTAAFECTLVPFESNRRFSWLHRSPPKSAKARRPDWKSGCDMIFELTIKNRTRLTTVISDGRGN